MKKGSQKKNKYAHLSEPQAEFDFHGTDPFLGKEGIRQLAQTEIQRFRNEGKTVIRFIVGKGLHSQNGPVIKPVVLDLLAEMKSRGEIRDYSFDSAFGTGPNQGAVVVKLSTST